MHKQSAKQSARIKAQKPKKKRETRHDAHALSPMIWLRYRCRRAWLRFCSYEMHRAMGPYYGGRTATHCDPTCTYARTLVLVQVTYTFRSALVYKLHLQKLYKKEIAQPLHFSFNVYFLSSSRRREYSPSLLPNFLCIRIISWQTLPLL